MAEVLLISETFVKEVCSISENIAGQYILPSIREAQDINLRNILGDNLLTKLKQLIASGDISLPENAKYKALADQQRYFLAYSACVGIAQRVTFKVANAGVVKTPDERVEVTDQPDMEKVKSFYQAKADSLAFDLERWVLIRYMDYPELSQFDYLRVRSHLRTAATCGVWLGGPRGKVLPGVPIRDLEFERTRQEELMQ